MRLNFNKMLFTCDLNLRSVDIVRPRCLWSSVTGIGIPSNLRTGIFGDVFMCECLLGCF